MANPFLDWLMPRITNLHHLKWFMALVVLGCIYALCKGRRELQIAILCSIVAVSASDLLAYRVLKVLIHRERPCYLPASQNAMLHPPKFRMVPGEHCPGSPSFPSNHASNMMALGTVAWWFTKRKTRWLWFLIPLIIGYSRVYLGFHYPSDVLGGWLIGAAIGGAVVFAANRLFGAKTTATEPVGQSDQS